MAKKLENKKSITLLTLVCLLTYFAGYLTRVNYKSTIVEIIASEGLKKESLSYAAAGFAITYGLGQLISGYVGQKASPKLLVFTGLLGASIISAVMPMASDTRVMTTLWCVNGVAQALMWPPMVRLLAEMLRDSDYKKACVKIAWGGLLGMAFVYLTAPFLIKIGTWKLVFFVTAAMGGIIAAIWYTYIGKIYKNTAPMQVNTKEAEQMNVQTGYGFLLGIIMVIIVLHGVLRDGVSTWMPTYISESFGISSSSSIFAGVLLPLCSLISINISGKLQSKLFTNELICVGVFFGVGLLASIMLVVFSKSVYATVILITFLQASMEAANLILIGIVPLGFNKTGKISIISGALNFSTYVGAALSTYGFALLADKFGWGATVYSWIAVTALGVILCILVSKMWINFKRDKI